MSDEARASLAVANVLQKEHKLSRKRSCEITPDNVEKLPAIFTLPRDGSVSYTIDQSQYKFTTKDGKLDGEFLQFKRNVLCKKAYYKDSMLNGPYQEFFENGSQVKISGSYKDDKKHGIWKYYDQEGKVIKTELWKDGVDETAKYAIMRKVSAKHAEHREPVTKIGKAIQKTVKAIEVRQELKKLQQYSNG
jgi:antitoxin component YwqK of YwqJK toxin-antitoxin module